MDKRHFINNWVNANRSLLQKYIGKWIAYTEDGLIAVGDSIEEVSNKAKEINENHWVFFVNPLYYEGVRFRPIHFRSISFHDWQPLYTIELQFKSSRLKLPMLIDSGADGSLISYHTGVQLGLTLSEGETKQLARGIGGGVIYYVWRDIQISIDTHSLIIPIAWVVEGENQEEILGRAVVFDHFDIEFKQADEAIIFKKRPDPTNS
jgi:hypothetical protein